MRKKHILVIKFGSSTITDSKGDINEHRIVEIARQVAVLQKQYHIVLVSSGAVAAGRKFIPGYAGKLSERKAAAAIGNPLLLRKYNTYFKPYKISLAQSLCERHHFSNREQLLQLKDTYETLWKHNVIPIANENDVVSDRELKFSDNDELATLIAACFDAELLLFSTSVAGLMDEGDRVIRSIGTIDKQIFSLVRKEKSAAGLGGMTSKLNFARLANQMGIRVVIFDLAEENALLNAEKGEIGTVCLPAERKVSTRRKWIASGSLISGKLLVDAGAVEAIKARKSLLGVGVDRIEQDFVSGEVIQLADGADNVFAVARSKMDSKDICISAKRKNQEIANADDIVLL